MSFRLLDEQATWKLYVVIFCSQGLSFIVNCQYSALSANQFHLESSWELVWQLYSWYGWINDVSEMLQFSTNALTMFFSGSTWVPGNQFSVQIRKNYTKNFIFLSKVIFWACLPVGWETPSAPQSWSEPPGFNFYEHCLYERQTTGERALLRMETLSHPQSRNGPNLDRPQSLFDSYLKNFTAKLDWLA